MTESTLKKYLQEQLLENPFLPTYAVVVKVLKNEVHENRLKAGDRLKEIETAEKLGVGRSTVRRAFDVLVLEGVFIRSENRGVRVAQLVSAKYRDLMEIRAMLDAQASQLAAIRRTDQDLLNMQEAINLAREANIDSWAQTDSMFHMSVYEASKNSYILRIYNEFDMEIIRSRYQRAEDAIKHKDDIISDHIKIFNAIRDQDQRLAALSSIEHTRKLLDPAMVSDQRLLEY